MSEPISNDEIPDKIELPAPTAWPMIAAFGFCLLSAGLLTHWSFSAVGAVLILRGFVGWWREVLPHDHHEYVPVVAPEFRPKPIVSKPESVEHLRLGEGGHRVRIPAEMHPYSAGVKGGLVGGVVMAALALLYGIVMQGSIWYPVNLLAGAVMPEFAGASVETLKAFNLWALLIGIVMHGSLSIIIGLLYAVALPMFPKFAWLWAGILTPLFWTGLFHASIGMLNPALAERVDWFWFVICQLGYGMVGGYVVARSQKIETMQTWPLEARIGIEAKVIGADQGEDKE